MGQGRLRCVCFLWGGGKGVQKQLLDKNSSDSGSHSELKSLTPCRHFCL